MDEWPAWGTANCPVHGPRTQDGHGHGCCNEIVGYVQGGKWSGWPILCGLDVSTDCPDCGLPLPGPHTGYCRYSAMHTGRLPG